MNWIVSAGRVCLVGLTLLSCATVVAQNKEPIQPIPTELDVDPVKVELGKKLFHDVRLSSDNTVSCASCHDLDNAGVDALKVSQGVGKRNGKRNAPTVFNSRFNFKQFWDGRANDLKQQVAFPLINPDEMGMPNVKAVIDKLAQTSDYPPLFQQAFGSELTADALFTALEEFQKTLITPNSRFDQYLKGDEAALSEREMRGYSLFKSYGCASCHQGVNVGGNMFQKFGVLKDINLRNGGSDDLGRYAVTKNEWEKYVFKVPSLRLAAVTPPYFHDGSAATIEDAVDVMIEFQLGRQVPIQDRDDIIAFLKSLVGEYGEMEQ